ncbi:MAG: hypothetical protein M9894_28270 [Planctomycetes bacterium]|nr:hypothetical protein [Planctomycetota bacterium]
MTPSLRRRVWDAAMTGVPFGVFKLGLGVYLHAHVAPALGVVVVVWGALDVLLNLVALAAPRVSFCLLSNVGRLLDARSRQGGWEALLLAVDTLLSFGIVAGMVGLRLLPDLPEALRRAWDVAVVLNVLAAGLERVWVTAQARAAARRAAAGGEPA